MRRPEYVFAYGSLTASTAGVPAALPGWRRGWGVAMDNRRDLPGYKVYLAADGSRPSVYVCFLDIAPADGGTVGGLCLPVDPARLAELDVRERNYRRIEVTGTVVGPSLDATVWTYVGSLAGRTRLRAGLRSGIAVIDRAYLARVRAGFRGLEVAERPRALASLDPGGIPVVDLIRRELP